MRAICGAIITAGALIGLGLTSIGYGIRYQGKDVINENTKQLYGAPSLMIALVVLLLAMFVGLGIAFLGLAYHHYQRYHEHLREHGAPTTTTTPRATV
jgi:putative Mn2+ efflux pump MntP